MEPLIPVCPKSRVAIWDEELQMKRSDFFSHFPERFISLLRFPSSSLELGQM